MTIGDIKPGGWAINEKLTSAQMNAVRAGFLKALDRSVAGDTISGLILVDATGGMTFQAGSILTVQSTLDIEGNAYWDAGSTLAMSGQITFENASQIIWKNGSLTQVQAGALWSILAGSTISCDGALTCSDLTMSGTTRVKVASRNLTRVVNSPGVSPEVGGVPGFAPDRTAIGAYEQLLTAVLNGHIQFEIKIPHNNKLTGASIRFLPPGTHVAQPTNLPTITLYRRDVTAGSPGTLTSLGSTTYTWVDIPTYEGSAHTISVSIAALTIDRTKYRYFVSFGGERGLNAVAGLLVEHPTVTETITEYDEG